MKLSEAIRIGKEGMEQWDTMLFDNKKNPKACCALGAAYLGWCKVTGEKFDLRITSTDVIDKFKFEMGENPYEKGWQITRWNDGDNLSFDEIIVKLEEMGL